MNRDELKNRIAGALYGVAIGDALGAPLEFMSADRIKEQHGQVTDMIGGGWLNVEPGEITDDTQMTLAVAEGIVEKPGYPFPAIGRRFVKWMKSGPKDIGGTCGSSIARIASRSHQGATSKDEWHRAARDTAKANRGRSGGNGALMRTVYPGLYYTNKETAARMAVDIGRMTHWDEKSTEACFLYTTMIHLITEAVINEDLSKPLAEMLAGSEYDLVELLSEDEDSALNPTGYVVDSFKCALSCFYTTRTFEDAVIKAANLGGDADTIAAITGGLAGAIYGYNSIPERWVDALAPAIRTQLDRLADSAVKNREAKCR